ncbi:hypothetical protein VPG91_22565 [Nitrospirillum amazonense]|uniref:hypothetical protein n=1 Tax=Nitrospirillum amazonense TaxID=28077 RepID=UPI002DD42A71|nr:hypothetical protein [Nitrospirillum amazonense]MEC4593802.1 hypothetical protein [Nitrospirillum amazonense]
MSQESPPQLPPPVTSLMSRTIDRLRRLKVQPDPIVPIRYRQSYGVLTSAVRSDGQLLEMAIYEALRAMPHLTVIRTPPVFIPAVVDQIISSSMSDEALRQSSFHYERGNGRRIAPDLVLIDANRQAIDFLELKRGLAKTDSGKTRQTIRDLRCLRLMGRRFAHAEFGVDVTVVTAAVCPIHGVTAVPVDLQVGMSELENRYGADLSTAVSAAYTEFGRQLEELLSQPVFEQPAERSQQLPPG